jgi:hypothetical protein
MFYTLCILCSYLCHTYFVRLCFIVTSIQQTVLHYLCSVFDADVAPEVWSTIVGRCNSGRSTRDGLWQCVTNCESRAEAPVCGPSPTGSPKSLLRRQFRHRLRARPPSKRLGLGPRGRIRRRGAGVRPIGVR